MKIHFWKVLSFVGIMSSWAEDSLEPDPDGVVRITVDEMTTLAEKACKAFGWKAEIVVHKPKKQTVPLIPGVLKTGGTSDVEESAPQAPGVPKPASPLYP